MAGSNNLTAAYSGDTNFDPSSSLVVTQVVNACVGLTTKASPSVPAGGSVSDTATLGGGNNPTGTITFNLFGPSDPTCALTPLATTIATVTGDGDYSSDPFVATTAGTYRFVASYGGDANNRGVPPAGCVDPSESVVVTPMAPPKISLTKTPSPASRPAPGGAFTFTVVVTDTGSGPVTLNKLTDNVYGDLNGKGTCATGANLTVGTTYACSFSGTSPARPGPPRPTR